MPARDTTKLSERIFDARQDARLTQSELAKRIGVSRAAVGQYEQGRSKPSIGSLRKIADVTGRPMAWFMIEDAQQAMVSARQSPSDSSVEMLAALPPIVRLAFERKLKKAAIYAARLPEWVRNSPTPQNEQDLDAAIRSINQDIDDIES